MLESNNFIKIDAFMTLRLKQDVTKLFQTDSIHAAVERDKGNLWVVGIIYANDPKAKISEYVGVRRGGIHRFKTLDGVLSYLVEVGAKRFFVNINFSPEHIKTGAKNKKPMKSKPKQ